MAELETVSGGSNGQVSTQNPQTAPQADNNSARAGQVQPGTARALLNNTQGVTLTNTPVTVVPVGATQTTIQQTVAKAPAKNEINPAALTLPIMLFLVAIVLFYVAGRADKKHNR